MSFGIVVANRKKHHLSSAGARTGCPLPVRGRSVRKSFAKDCIKIQAIFFLLTRGQDVREPGGRNVRAPTADETSALQLTGSPLQLSPQHFKVISIRRTNQIKRRLAS